MSDRSKDSVSNRSLLAHASVEDMQSSAELESLAEYKRILKQIEADQAKLQETRVFLRQIHTAGNLDYITIKNELQESANQIVERINVNDRTLVTLEATPILSNILNREKKKAFERLEQRGKEAFAASRERETQKQKELMQRYQNRLEENRRQREQVSQVPMRVSGESIQRAINNQENLEKKGKHQKIISSMNDKPTDIEPRDRLDKLETRLSIIRLVAIALCVVLLFSLDWLSESVFAHNVLKEHTTIEPYEYVSGTVSTYVCYTTTYGSCYHADYCGALWNSSRKTTVYEAEQRGYEPCTKCTPYEEANILLKEYGYKDVIHTIWVVEPASKFMIWLLGTGGIVLFYFVLTINIRKKINELHKSLGKP